MKERIKAKAEVNRILREKMEKEKMAQMANAKVSPEVNLQQQIINDEELVSIFSSGEKAEKTPRGAKPNKKKKGKK
jgi:hypothetical protein